jgi:hypothetical protein
MTSSKTKREHSEIRAEIGQHEISEIKVEYEQEAPKHFKIEDLRVNFNLLHKYA